MTNGRKDDQSKNRFDLLPFAALEEIAKVLTFGARKYDDENWRKVPNLRRRYFGAFLRHATAWRLGELTDPETGCHHLAHAACCLLFILSEELGHDPDFDGPTQALVDLMKNPSPPFDGCVP